MNTYSWQVAYKVGGTEYYRWKFTSLTTFDEAEKAKADIERMGYRCYMYDTYAG